MRVRGFYLPALLLGPVLALAQPPRQNAPPQTAREAAPVDLTGYWVSVVSEDWRWRMVTPLPGDFASVPLNTEGRRVGESWDPAADEAAGLECKSYGAPAIMRVPGRVHITWRDESTLALETDSGTQTRLFHFDAPPSTSMAPSWQGYSVANWERPAQGPEAPDPIGIFSRRIANKGRSLEVTTSDLRPGYLRKNGVPYSEQTTVREFYDYHEEPNGDEWFTVTTIVDDPVYLRNVFITSSDFKKEPNASEWNPTPCSAR
jgi:hypothetical protein